MRGQRVDSESVWEQQRNARVGSVVTESDIGQGDERAELRVGIAAMRRVKRSERGKGAGDDERDGGV